MDHAGPSVQLSRFRRYAVIGRLALFFFVADVSSSLYFVIDPGHEELSVPFIVGIFAGQVALVASWGALGPGSGLLRFVWTLCLGVVIWYSVLVVSLIADWIGPGPHLDKSGALRTGYGIIGCMLGFMVPLWIARVALQWQLTQASTDRRNPLRQYSLRNLLVVTVVVAVLLAVGRQLLPPGDGLGPDAADLFSPFGMSCFHGATVILPALSATRRSEQRPLLFVLATCAGYCLLLTIAEMVVLGILSRGEALIAGLFGFLYVLQFVMAGTLVSSLRWLRLAGFRLVKGHAERRGMAGANAAESESRAGFD